MKKRLIHLNLMVWKDTRMTIGAIESLKLGLSLLIKAKTSSGEFSTTGVPQKMALWVENTLVRVLDSNGYFYI